MGRLVLVSNRIPVAGARVGSTGGLAVALSDVLAHREALWIGWNGELSETPGEPTVRSTRRTKIVGFDLSPALHAGFYAGFSNGSLWPLFHYRLGLVEYRRADYQAYLEVNARVAALVMAHLRPDDTIWIHDFHLIPLARAMRALGATQPIGFFLHIPFPAAELFRSLPVHADLADAFSHFDLVGSRPTPAAGSSPTIWASPLRTPARTRAAAVGRSASARFRSASTRSASPGSRRHPIRASRAPALPKASARAHS